MITKNDMSSCEECGTTKLQREEKDINNNYNSCIDENNDFFVMNSNGEYKYDVQFIGQDIPLSITCNEKTYTHNKYVGSGGFGRILQYVYGEGENKRYIVLKIEKSKTPTEKVVF